MHTLPLQTLTRLALLPAFLAFPLLAHAWYTPTLNATFVYDLESANVASPVISTKTGLSLREEVYIVDEQGTSAETISGYHANGKKVICYLSAGSWEPSRPDALAFPPACYCGASVPYSNSTGECTGSNGDTNKLDGWTEWYLDIRSDGTCINEIKGLMGQRMTNASAKGCDGVDPDNVDGYSAETSFGITMQDEVDYLLWLSSTAHSLNMSIDLKNAPDLLINSTDGSETPWQAQLVQAFDFNVIEECHRDDACDNFNSFLQASKPQIQIEYSSYLKTCPTLEQGQRLAVYSGTLLDSSEIVLECQESYAVGSGSSTNTTTSGSAGATNATGTSSAVAGSATSASSDAGRAVRFMTGWAGPLSLVAVGTVMAMWD